MTYIYTLYTVYICIYIIDMILCISFIQTQMVLLLETPVGSPPFCSEHQPSSLHSTPKVIHGYTKDYLVGGFNHLEK